MYFIGEQKLNKPIIPFIVKPIGCFNLRSELLNNPVPTIIEDYAALNQTVSIFTDQLTDEGAYTLN